MKRWFNPKYHGEPYSLRAHAYDIDKWVSAIKPPNEINRLPRSVDQMSFYKASEYRSWLLYYSLPLFFQLLPPDYVHHLALLVAAMHILLSDSISQKDLESAHCLLMCFHDVAGDLYDPSIYTINLHTLVHTVPFAQLWGPVWSYSMFGFENLNGYLGHTYHGTTYIVQQIAFEVQLKQTLPEFLREIMESESSSTRVAIEHLFDSTCSRAKMYQISESCYYIGKAVCDKVTENEQAMLTSAGIHLQSPSVQRFGRFMMNGVVFHSTMYGAGRNGKRNNCICSYKSESSTSDVDYGVIHSFCATQEADPFMFIEQYATAGILPVSDIPQARLERLHRLQVDVSHQLQARMIAVPKMTPALASGNIVVVPLRNVMKKCIKIPVKHSRYDYIITLPNSYEFH